PGPDRADLLQRLGDTCHSGLDYRASADYFRDALAEQVMDDKVRARCELGLAITSQLLQMPASQMNGHARPAAGLVQGLARQALFAGGPAPEVLRDLSLGQASAGALTGGGPALEPAGEPGKISPRASKPRAYMRGLPDAFGAALAGFEADRH